MKEVYEEIRKETHTAFRLRELAMDNKNDKGRADELRKEQDKHYKKLQFLKKFCEAKERVK